MADTTIYVQGPTGPVALRVKDNGDGTWSILPAGPTVFKPQNAVAIASEATIWAPATGKKFRLMRAALVSSVAGNIVLRDNTAGTIIAIIPSGAGGSPVPIEFGPGILSGAANNVLTATGPAASTLSGTVMGTEE